MLLGKQERVFAHHKPLVHRCDLVGRVSVISDLLHTAHTNRGGYHMIYGANDLATSLSANWRHRDLQADAAVSLSAEICKL